MQKWDYMKVNMYVGNFDIEKLKQFGEEGWELVTTLTDGGGMSTILVFKRPKQ